MPMTRTASCLLLVLAGIGCAGEPAVPKAAPAANVVADPPQPSSAAEDSAPSPGATDEGSSEHGLANSGEHRGERTGEHDSASEEAGTEYALTESYDNVRRGARPTLAFDATANAFVGAVQNVTETTLKRVRVEVHLSNGIELGPTRAVDLKPGETSAVRLPAGDGPFVKWSAHPEVGNGEHGRG